MSNRSSPRTAESSRPSSDPAPPRMYFSRSSSLGFQSELETGRFVAIDRSKKMIDAASRRNEKYVDARRAEFHVADVLEFNPGRRRFGKILAVRVALFHRDAAAAKARSRIQSWLRPGGQMLLIYDEPWHRRPKCPSTLPAKRSDR